MRSSIPQHICELENCPITDYENNMCSNCTLFLNTCQPIASGDGYALGSEADCYLCYGCTRFHCPYSYM
jgi:hypothetical protein